MIKFNKATGFWEVSYSKRHPKTRMPYSRKKINLKSEAEARRTERQMVAELELKFQEQVVPKWFALVQEFMESKLISDWTQKTYQNCQFNLNAHTIPIWGDRLIDSITTKEIRDLLLVTVGDRSESTKQSLLKFIRGAFEYAVEAGYINRNPAPTIRFKIGKKIENVLTEEQIRHLLHKAKEFDSPWYYHWALAVYTGMRNGELYALTWDKVNLEGRTIRVDSAWNKVDGFKSTKSGDDRIVEIAPNLLLVLKELKLKSLDQEFVLPRSRNWEKGEQARFLRMFLMGLGLPPVRFHDLRASWATIMLTKGVEPIKVMSMGGWTNLKTMGIYIRKAGITIKGITDKLELHDPLKEAGQVLELKRK